MAERNTEQLGALVQAYVRAKWGNPPDSGATLRLGARLDARLRDRIDVLGLDSEHLLDAEAVAVFAKLERLEYEATLEDARVAASAVRARAREEKQIHDPANPARRKPRVHPGRHRKPAGHGRGRQRGKR